jgi:glycosyltransferase involved in cell wall biosynthesis
MTNNQSKTILIITPSSTMGGAERNIALLAEHLPRDRFELSLATTFGSGDLTRRFRELGLVAEEFRYAENPLRWLDLYRFVKKTKPEIIHSFLLRGNWIAWALTRLIKGIPWIASERGLDITRPKWKAALNRFFLRKADLILAVSEPVRQILIDRDRLPPEKIEVLTGGVPPPQPPLPWPEVWPDLPRPRIVVLSHLRDEKNVGLAIAAFVEATKRGAAGSLTLMGDGAEREKLERMANESGLMRAVPAPSPNNRIFFAGRVLEGRRLLHHFDLLVLPSKEEGFPNVILEAWQAGIAVLSTDTPGARFIAGPEAAARLVEPNELHAHLAALIDDDAERKRLSELGRARVGEFEIERVIQRVITIWCRC